MITFCDEMVQITTFIFLIIWQDVHNVLEVSLSMLKPIEEKQATLFETLKAVEETLKNKEGFCSDLNEKNQQFQVMQVNITFYFVIS